VAWRGQLDAGDVAGAGEPGDVAGDVEPEGVDVAGVGE
jgi:hypothetical protein